jgi:hypothetical protein
MLILAGLGLGWYHTVDFSSIKVLDGAECFYEILSLLNISRILAILGSLRAGCFASPQGMFLVF